MNVPNTSEDLDATRRTPDEPRHTLQQGAIGLAGGLLGAFAMNQFARAVNAANGGRESKGAAPGHDRVGRGVQPPQAHGRAEEDAAVHVGTVAYRALAGHEPRASARPWLGSAAHYAFGGTMGVCYALLADRAPLLRTGYGALFGTLVGALADVGAMPALGLSRGPRQLPPGVHAFALAGHWVFGAALESVRRYGSRALQPA